MTNQLVQAVKFVQDKARLATFYTRIFLQNLLYWTRGHQLSVMSSSIKLSCKISIHDTDFFLEHRNQWDDSLHVRSLAVYPDIPRASWDGRWGGKYCHGVGTAKSVRWRLWAKPRKLVSGHPGLPLKYGFYVTNQLVQAVKFVQDKARLATFYPRIFLRNLLYWTRVMSSSIKSSRKILIHDLLIFFFFMLGH